MRHDAKLYGGPGDGAIWDSGYVPKHGDEECFANQNGKTLHVYRWCRDADGWVYVGKRPAAGGTTDQPSVNRST